MSSPVHSTASTSSKKTHQLNGETENPRAPMATERISEQLIAALKTRYGAAIERIISYNPNLDNSDILKILESPLLQGLRVKVERFPLKPSEK